MQSNGDFHFHKGHYLEDDIDDSLCKVENEEYSQIQCEDKDAADYLYIYARLFLYSSCHLFALALYEEFKYKTYEIKDHKDRLIHVFCMATYRGQPVYIDVRGITTDFVEFVSAFYIILRDGYRIVAYDIEGDRGLEEDGDKTGYRFAQSIIKKYRGYYDTSI